MLPPRVRIELLINKTIVGKLMLISEVLLCLKESPKNVFILCVIITRLKSHYSRFHIFTNQNKTSDESILHFQRFRQGRVIKISAERTLITATDATHHGLFVITQFLASEKKALNSLFFIK